MLPGASREEAESLAKLSQRPAEIFRCFERGGLLDERCEPFSMNEPLTDRASEQTWREFGSAGAGLKGYMQKLGEGYCT